MGIEDIPTLCGTDKYEQNEEKETVFQKERVIYAVAAALLAEQNENDDSNKRENEIIEKMDWILDRAENIRIVQYDKRRQNPTKPGGNGKKEFAEIGVLFLPPNSSAQEAPVGEFIVEIANYSEIKSEDLLKIRNKVSDLCFGDNNKLIRFDEVISQRLKNNY